MKTCLKYAILGLCIVFAGLSMVSFYDYHFVSKNVTCGDSEFECDKVDSAEAIIKFWVGVANVILSVVCFVAFYTVNKVDSRPILDEEEGREMIDGWIDARSEFCLLPFVADRGGNGDGQYAHVERVI